MKRSASRPAVRSVHGSHRPSLSPYFIDETAFTRADILRGRASDDSSVVR